MIKNFGTWKWFQDEYNMTETGRLEGALPNDSDEDPETPGKGLCPSSRDPSRFASKEKLVKLCTMVAKGRHDFAFASLGKAMGHTSTLDLSAESMRNLLEFPLRMRIQVPWWTLRRRAAGMMSWK